ncbi:MAG: GNAT family N-acetyltransferase [Anaerolineales bacterium]
MKKNLSSFNEDPYRITIEAPPSRANIKTLERHLVEFNESRVERLNLRKLAFFLRDEKDRIVGGLYGETYWGWLFVSLLWVDEGLQGRGYGRELMRLAEAEAVKRGCKQAYLDTFDFQALDFYKKIGYQIFGSLDDFPEGHTRYFLQKRIL